MRMDRVDAEGRSSDGEYFGRVRGLTARVRFAMWFITNYVGRAKEGPRREPDEGEHTLPFRGTVHVQVR